MLGWSFEHLSVGGLVMGWGIAQCVVVFNTVAVCKYGYFLFPNMLSVCNDNVDAYCNDCFPDRQVSSSRYEIRHRIIVSLLNPG